MPPPARLKLPLLLAGLLLAHPVHADRIHGPSVDIPVYAGAGARFGPRITPDGRNGAIIAWYDYRDPSGSSDIYAQAINAGGSLRWRPEGVALCVASGEQYNVALVPDGDQGAIAAWTDHRARGDSIYAQRVSKEGLPVWAPNGVSLFSPSGVTPVIASDDFGGALVACEHALSGDAILAQRVDANGRLLWGASGVVVATGGRGRYAPKIISDGAGGAYLAWTSVDLLGERIFGQHISADGRPLWPNGGRALCPTNSNAVQRCGALVSDHQGGMIVVWADHGPTLSVFAQRFGDTGTPLWDSLGVRLATHIPHEPVWYLENIWISAISGDGGAIIAWHDRTSGDYEIYAQRVLSSGVIAWDPDGVFLCRTPGEQTYPQLASDGHGGTFAVWGAPFAPAGIYGQHVDAFGAVQWGTGGRLVSDDAGIARPVIAGSGNMAALLAWENFGIPSSSILAHRLMWNGASVSPGRINRPMAAKDWQGASGVRFQRPTPNPFSDTSCLRFFLPRRSHVSLRIYDTAGRLVRELLDLSDAEPGDHAIDWDGRGDLGFRCPPGLYLCRLSAGDVLQTRRISLLD